MDKQPETTSSPKPAEKAIKTPYIKPSLIRLENVHGKPSQVIAEITVEGQPTGNSGPS